MVKNLPAMQKTQVRLCMKQKQNQGHGNRLVIAKGDGHAGIGQEVGTGRCKLLCTDWINNKVLQYSRGNSIQYHVINYSESESQSVMSDSL